MSLPLLLAMLALLSLATAAPPASSLCFLMYAIPGTIDYPWSSAIALNFSYLPPSSSSADNSSVVLVSGSGTRTYTNRYGAASTTALTLTPATSSADNLLLLSSPLPLDSLGLLLNLSGPTPFPGGSPTHPLTTFHLYAAADRLVEGGGAGIDARSSAYVSGVPGFNNVSMPSTSINALVADPVHCLAPITFVNGRRTPVQPSVFNGATQFQYAFSLSDGVNYSVSTQLNVTCSSAFATTKDALGNAYQIVVNVTGTRVYTHLPTLATLTSTVTLTPNTPARWYPYTLLEAAPGVYNGDLVPHLDGDGWELALQPPVPADGLAPKAGEQYPTQTVKVWQTSGQQAVLYETHSLSLPVRSLQTQDYTLPPRAGGVVA